MILEISFLALNNADFQFDAKKFTWRSYTVIEALSTTSQIEFVDKKEFAKAAFDGNSEIFVVHVAILEIITTMLIYPYRTSQVEDNSILSAL